MPKVGYPTSNTSPSQVTVAGSFDTNSTSAPDGVRGRFEVSRTGVGVFKVELAADPNAPAGTYTQWDSYQVQIHGASDDSKLYVARVTAEDATVLRPYLTITIYIRTYAAGAIDTYAAADTTDVHVTFNGTLLKAAAF